MKQTTLPDRTRFAVMVIVFTVFALSLGDALIKNSSANLVLWQIFVLRSCLIIPLLFGILRMKYSTVGIIPTAFIWTLIRSLMLSFMWVIYYAALPHLQLSVAAAAYYTLPIFITLFSALFVGEKVKPLGWLAVLLGFCGVGLILQPKADDFNFYALLPLASAVLYALSMILTRTKCSNEHPLVLSLALNISFVVVGLLAPALLNFASFTPDAGSFLSTSWVVLTQSDFMVLIVLAIAILIGSIGAAIAYQIGRSSVIATFDFAYVAFAVLWGVIFFGDIPDVTMLAGMMLIVVSGIMAVRQ
ncbi:DMT family transporter [Amylibacter sp. SFDW26]|uniref:DMT family transporter n=1 Tax=Amylibacter sp. SFDW26 TaxID=2652722 RepID=UPI001D029351|nr:DMT family transporter [Amylibacter sp. SFDW26]